ncbi:MAG: AsmA-like C-terminal region-containing protein [Pseudomonadales bacterium]
MPHLIFRPLLVLLTLSLLVIALMQSLGRVGAALLDDLEPAVNQLLSPARIRVHGLHGDWRLLNPIIRIDRVEMPAGELQGVVFELAAAESALRSDLVAHRVQVRDGRLNLERAADGSWHLAGSRGGTSFDPLPLLLQSDQLELELTLALADGRGEDEALRLSYLGGNQGGEHRHRVRLRNLQPDCAGCALQLDYHGRDGLWPLRAVEQRVRLSADGFRVPRPLLGPSALTLDHLNFSWQRGEARSQGAWSIRADGFQLPGGGALATTLTGEIGGTAERQLGSIRDWQLTEADQTWTLPDVHVEVTPELVLGWIETLDLGTAARFAEGALAGVEPAASWVRALAIEGRAHNLRGYYRPGSKDFGYAATLDGLNLEGYKGIPWVRGVAGELIGYAHGMQLNVNAEALDLQFPDMFTKRWRVSHVQGPLQAWFGQGYFGVRGYNLRADLADPAGASTRASGGFAITRPDAHIDQRLTLLLHADEVSVDAAKRFVPYTLPAELTDWIELRPHAGLLRNGRLALHGQFKVAPGEPGRRIEVAADLRGAAVRYLDEWPEVTDLDGSLHVAGTQVRVHVDSARSAGARLVNSSVTVQDRGSAVDVQLDAALDGGAALDLVRDTPLRHWLRFVRPEWQASGPLRLEGSLHVPLRLLDGGSALEDGLSVRLRGDLDGVDLTLPDYRLELSSLSGTLRYRYPYTVEGSGLSATLFGQPVAISATTAEDQVRLQFAGRAAPADAWTLAGVEDPGFAQGLLDYDAQLAIGVREGAGTELSVRSDLQGVAVALPGPLAKPADSAVPLLLRVAFSDAGTRLEGSYADTRGWLELADRPLRGALGFGGAAPAAASDEEVLTVGGHVVQFALEDVLPGGGVASGAAGAAAEGPLPLPVRLQDLTVDRIDVGDYAIHGARLAGTVRNDGFDLDVRSDDLSGTFTRAADTPLDVQLALVRVPSADTMDVGPTTVEEALAAAGEPFVKQPEARDPLRPDLIAQLPEAEVSVARLQIGDEDFGSWSFRLKPVAGAAEIRDLAAQVKGVAITAPEGLTWRAAPHETSFTGQLTAQNLADVLPQWGYAPQVETQSASLEGSFTWQGSPAAVDLRKLVGEATMRADTGRFRDIDTGTGTLRIFSLLNFTAIAKRISFDFSDVRGKGVSFERLRAKFSLDHGLLQLLEPMEVNGTGSSFQVAGTVDLNTGRLDNEMIVTLPVSKSLPWYAAYVALANPIAGLGVLVGERVLRKPLEQFSSAKYRIGGTLDEPEVTFVDIFNTAMDKPAATADGQPQTPEGTTTDNE